MTENSSESGDRGGIEVSDIVGATASLRACGVRGGECSSILSRSLSHRETYGGGDGEWED